MNIKDWIEMLSDVVDYISLPFIGLIITHNKCFSTLEFSYEVYKMILIHEDWDGSSKCSMLTM